MIMLALKLGWKTLLLDGIAAATLGWLTWRVYVEGR